MKSKRLLRFYFNADGLDGEIDKLILRYAYKSADGSEGGEYYAERILALIEAKDRLSELWNYLDDVITGLGKTVIAGLQDYAAMRHGIKRLSAERQKEIKRTVIKFVRHARSAHRFTEGIQLVNKYYCLM